MVANESPTNNNNTQQNKQSKGRVMASNTETYAQI